MVGRQGEVQTLSDALGRALAGEQATVVVGGEAGVGKSRLVQELVGKAREAGARVLVGSCIELDGGGIPFAPVVEMMRDLAADLPAGELDAALGPARAEVGRLVPELDESTPEMSADDRDPARLLELMLGVVGRLAASAPLILAFEDVQWADRATLDLFPLLVARATGRRLLLVFTVRSDELHRAHPFRRMAARWEQQRTVLRMELPRLDPRGVAAQIEAILGQRPDGELVDFIAERSEGIPLFVEELLDVTREGRLDPDYLPPSLRDVVLARAELLAERSACAPRRVGHRPLGAGPPAGARGWTPRARAACGPAGGGRAAVAGRRSRRDAGTASATPWPARRFTMTCSLASARSFTRPMPRPSRTTPSWPGLIWMPARCSPITGSRPTTSPERFRRRSGPGRLPPRPERHRPPSATSSAPSSCGPRWSTPSTAPEPTIPSCSRRPLPQRPGPGRSTGPWPSSTRPWPRSAIPGPWNAVQRCSCAEPNCSSI